MDALCWFAPFAECCLLIRFIWQSFGVAPGGYRVYSSSFDTAPGLRLVRLFHPYRCTWPRGHFARCSSFGWRTLFDDASSLGFVQFSHGYHTLHCAGLRSHRLRIMPFTIESPLTGAGHGLWQVDTQLACCGWCSIRFGMRHVVKFFFLE